MSNDANHSQDMLPLVELAGSLGLTTGQRDQLLDCCRRTLDAQAHRLRAGSEARGTGLGPAPGERILPLREAERRHLTAALKHTAGKIYGRDGAAKLLDLKPTTLQSKLKKHGIDRLAAAGEPSTSGERADESEDNSAPRPPTSMSTHAAVSMPAE